eukprot:gene28528-35377_t
MTPKKWHVGIIGAGASGLVNLKSLLEKNFTGECWEMQGDLGGVYLSTYQQAQLTTSNLSVTFSDYSYGDESNPRMYMANEYREYLRGYSEQYGLTPFLHFKKKVQKVEKSAEQPEKFNLIVECLQTGKLTTHTYDKIIVCTGANTTPAIPVWPGQETFKGKIVHSSVYDSPEDFRGKRVCLIGVGESGSDIAGLVAKAKAEAVGDEVLIKTSIMNRSQGSHAFTIFGTKNNSFVKAMVFDGMELKPSLERIEG